MRALDFEELKRTIESHRNSRVMITFHSIGDTDSVASAFSLSEYFPHSTIATPDFITSNSKHALDRLGFHSASVTTSFDKDAELIILVDVNNFEDCGSFKEKLSATAKETLIIDHHAPQNLPRGSILAFEDESYTSTSSIVFDILKSLAFALDGKTAELLASGIVSDSAEFRNSTPYTFTQIGELLKIAKKDYQTLLSDMRRTPAPENRLDAMKDLFHSDVSIKGGLVFSIGKSFHANIAADDAIKVGADAALFYSVGRTEVSFSARLRPLLDRERGIHIGRTMVSLAPLIKGRGGGHPCAAGAYGSDATAVQAFIDSFIEAVAGRNPRS